jgi:hypothetical protein
MAKYAMNLNDGSMDFNSEAVASNINWVEIDDEIHAAIKSGKLDWRIVANAVRAKRNNDPNFDWERFDILRDRLNVRKAKFDLKGAGDVTNAGTGGKSAAINPSVSFVELDKVDAGGASTEDNSNVGGLSHPAPAQKTRASSQKVDLKDL